jgi:hypothetical protein
MELSIRGPISRKNDGVCVRSVHFHLLASSDCLDQAHGRPSVPYVNIQNILFCVFLSLKKKNLSCGKQTKSFMDSKTSFLLLLLLVEQQQQEFARDSLFFYCRFADLHLFILYDVRRNNETKSRKTLAGTVNFQEMCFLLV